MCSKDTWPEFKYETLHPQGAEVHAMSAITNVSNMEISFVPIGNIGITHFSVIFYATAQKGLCTAFWKINIFLVLFLLTENQLFLTQYLFPVKPWIWLQGVLKGFQCYKALLCAVWQRFGAMKDPNNISYLRISIVSSPLYLHLCRCILSLTDLMPRQYLAIQSPSRLHLACLCSPA